MIEKQCLHLRPISSSRHGLRHSVYNACAKNNIITLVQYSLVIFSRSLAHFLIYQGQICCGISMFCIILIILILRETYRNKKLYRINILIVILRDIWFSSFTRQMFIFIYELHHDGNNLH